VKHDLAHLDTTKEKILKCPNDVMETLNRRVSDQMLRDWFIYEAAFFLKGVRQVKRLN